MHFTFTTPCAHDMNNELKFQSQLPDKAVEATTHVLIHEDDVSPPGRFQQMRRTTLFNMLMSEWI